MLLKILGHLFTWAFSHKHTQWSMETLLLVHVHTPIVGFLIIKHQHFNVFSFLSEDVIVMGESWPLDLLLTSYNIMGPNSFVNNLGLTWPFQSPLLFELPLQEISYKIIVGHINIYSQWYKNWEIIIVSIFYPQCINVARPILEVDFISKKNYN